MSHIGELVIVNLNRISSHLFYFAMHQIINRYWCAIRNINEKVTYRVTNYTAYNCVTYLITFR